jgi:hypothetical protein
MKIAQYTMARVYTTLKMPIFHGAGTKDPKQHLFVYEAIWTMKNVQDDNVKILQLVKILRDHTLLWYIKYQSTMPMGQARMSTYIKKSLLKEFQKPKFDS